METTEIIKDKTLARLSPVQRIMRTVRGYTVHKFERTQRYNFLGFEEYLKNANMEKY